MSDAGSTIPGRAPSEEEAGSEAGPSSRSAAAQSRRGTRGIFTPRSSTTVLTRFAPTACDRCRKVKSRCESTEGDKCRNCVAAGTGARPYYMNIIAWKLISRCQLVHSKVCSLYALTWRDATHSRDLQGQVSREARRRVTFTQSNSDGTKWSAY